MRTPREGLLCQEPSPTLKSFSKVLASLAPGPVLDCPSGYGRNALFLARLGMRVMCVDNDFDALQAIKKLDDLDLPLIPWTPGYATAARASYSAGEW